MNTPFQFPYLTQQQIKSLSKSRGKGWKSEQAYRDDCIDVIQTICQELKIRACTQERAIILMHRYFSATPSAQCTGLDKWAHALACFFICLKLDSNYDRLENVVHSSIVKLREAQGREMEPEYFNADGTRGNRVYLESLADKVRQAEKNVLLALNFALNISSPTTWVALYLTKVGLTEEAEMQYPDLADKINWVRAEAMQTAAASCGKGLSVVLQHPSEHIALAAIYMACRANRLQWYLGPPPEDKIPQAQRKPGHVQLPELSIERLQDIALDLPIIKHSGMSRFVAGAGEQQQNDGHGCFRSRGGRWLQRSPKRPALVKSEGGIRLSSTATDSSNGEAATGVRLCEPSPSPDSINGPPSALGSSGGGSSRAARRVTFGELPPSVALLQAQFRQRAAVEERYRRERSPEPCASLDSDLDDQQQQQQQGLALRLQGGQQQRSCGPVKRSREVAGLAAGADEEDSADSKGHSPERQADSEPTQQQQEGPEQADCAGSKRARVEAAEGTGSQSAAVEVQASCAGGKRALVEEADCVGGKRARVAV